MKGNGKPTHQPTIFRLARVLGVSESSVCRFRRNGMPADTHGAQAWLRRRQRTKDLDLERHKVRASGRFRKAQQRLAELELGQQTGDLIALAELRHQVIEAELRFKDRLLMIPRSLPPRLVGKSRAECEKVLTDAFRWACEPLDHLLACLQHE